MQRKLGRQTSRMETHHIGGNRENGEQTTELWKSERFGGGHVGGNIGGL